MIRERPALVNHDGIGDYREPAPGDRKVLCRFTNSTWWLVRVSEWARDGQGGWWCHISWHVAGRPHGGWFAYDAAQFAVPDTDVRAAR